MYMFIKMDRHQSRLFAAVYGEEPLNERMRPIERLGDIHEDWPEFFTSNFTTEAWGRMTYQYNICVTDGIRYIIGQYGGRITIGKIK